MDDQNIRSGTITAIEDQHRDPERVSVFLDGSFAFGIHRQVAAELGLIVGRRLEEPDVRAALSADEAQRAVAAALQFLAHRPRSAVEVERRLTRRGFSDGAREVAMTRLREWRYVDDTLFARAWVENRVEHQPRGRRLLKQELREKGVDAALVDEAIEDAEIDEFPAALRLAQKRVVTLQREEVPVQRRRLTAYLQRRGYGWDVVRRVLDTIYGEADEALVAHDE